MNAMLYVRGRPLDYDLWVEQGAPGWGWEDVLPYFLRSEDNARGASEFHAPAASCGSTSSARRGRSTGGCSTPAPPLGIPRIADYNGPEQDGVSMFQVTQRNGRRWSAADAFLRPARCAPQPRADHRRDRARARARGRPRRRRPLPAHAADGRRPPRAEREVILAPGAIGSPQILLLSGSARPSELREVGVEPRHELPGVGRNLQDHPFVTDALGGLGGPDALRRRQAQAPGRVAAAPHRPADLDGRRGRRLRPHPARACPPPTSSSTWARSTSRTTARRSSTATR